MKTTPLRVRHLSLVIAMSIAGLLRRLRRRFVQ